MARRVFTDAQKAQRKARVLERLANMTPEELEAWKAQQRANRHKWKRRHRATVNAMKRGWARRWREAHPEAAKARDRATYIKHKPKRLAESLARQRALRVHNVEKAREQGRAQMARRRARHRGATINDLSMAQWQEIKAAYDSRCVYCGRKMQLLTMDHIIPLSKGGQHTYTNIVPACRSCNARKCDRAPLVPVQPLLLIIEPPRQKRHVG